MYDAPGPARKRTTGAMSSGLPSRPSAICPMSAFRAASGSSAVMSVSMYPGATALTRTPRPASSLATALVRPMSPALDAA
jgi:hypothetical protein